MALVRLFDGSSGVNTRIDPAELDNSEFAVGLNIDITQRGRFSRRKGYVQVAAIPGAHSIFFGASYCLFCAGEFVYRLNPDFSYFPISQGISPDSRVSYAALGDTVYFVNGKGKAKYKGGPACENWVREGTYVGRNTTMQYGDPPAGSHIAYHRSRMYVAKGNELWASEEAAYGWFSLEYSYRLFPTKITILRPVRGGIYVGTKEEMWWLSGDMWPDFVQVKVSESKPIEWTDPYDLFDTRRAPALMQEGITGKAAMWTAVNALGYSEVWIGGESGAVKCLTVDTLRLPSANSGTGFLYDDKYVCLLDP